MQTKPFFLFILLLSIGAVLTSCAFFPQQQAKTKSTQPHIADKTPVYDGVNVDICLINPNSPDYIKNSQGLDLIDIAHHLGINLFRITNGGCTHNGSDQGIGTWDAVLRKMEKNGITAIIAAEPSTNDGEMTTDSLNYITSLVITNKLGTYPNVYGIDVMSEPTLDTNNITFIQQAIKQIKVVYPHLRLSVSGWRTNPGTFQCAVSPGKYCWNIPQDGHVFEGMLDYYSIHIYGYDDPPNGPYPDPYTFTTHFFDTILPYAQGKPVIIEEYGAANGDAITDQQALGTPELQANVTDGVLKAVQAYQNKNVIGSTQWAFYNRSYQTGTPGWALIKDHGNTIFPAAYVIQKDSTGISDIPLTLPLPITEKAYIFRNDDNGTTISLHKGDSIGFILTFNDTNNYSFTISNPSLFTITEPFMHNDRFNSFVSVIHAESTGNAVLTVKGNSCTLNCQSFQMTVTIKPNDNYY